MPRHQLEAQVNIRADNMINEIDAVKEQVTKTVAQRVQNYLPAKYGLTPLPIPPIGDTATPEERAWHREMDTYEQIVIPGRVGKQRENFACVA